jgi:hypothetical protein
MWVLMVFDDAYSSFAIACSPRLGQRYASADGSSLARY